MTYRLAVPMAAAVMLLAAAGSPAAGAAQEQPYLQVAPTSSPPGARIAVFGRGFCAAVGCPAAVVEVAEENAAPGAGQVIDSNVAVGSDGKFTLTFTAGAPGRYKVTAKQVDATGVTLSATAVLLVELQDIRPGETSTTLQTAPSSSTPGTAAATSTMPAMSTTSGRSSSTTAASIPATATSAREGPTTIASSEPSSSQDTSDSSELALEPAGSARDDNEPGWPILLLGLAALSLSGGLVVRRTRRGSR